MPRRLEPQLLPRWVHPDVITRSPPLSLVVVLALVIFDYVTSVLFHAGGGAAMVAVEEASEGWIHHSLAWGTVTNTVFAAIAFAAGVRLRHLGIDRRELRRWIATWVIAWSAIQVVMVVAAQLGLVMRLTPGAPLSVTGGIMLTLLLHTGLFEEILARGIVLPVLVRRFGLGAGIAIGALVFAGGHVPVMISEDLALLDALSSALQYWLWAVLASVLYLRSGSLLTIAALHAVYDYPTLFAITEGEYSALGFALWAGAVVYIWLRRWPSSHREQPLPARLAIVDGGEQHERRAHDAG